MAKRAPRDDAYYVLCARCRNGTAGPKRGCVPCGGLGFVPELDKAEVDARMALASAVLTIRGAVAAFDRATDEQLAKGD